VKDLNETNARKQLDKSLLNEQEMKNPSEWLNYKDPFGFKQQGIKISDTAKQAIEKFNELMKSLNGKDLEVFQEYVHSQFHGSHTHDEEEQGRIYYVLLG
jgi:hypothetical protein